MKVRVYVKTEWPSVFEHIRTYEVDRDQLQELKKKLAEVELE